MIIPVKKAWLLTRDGSGVDAGIIFVLRITLRGNFSTRLRCIKISVLASIYTTMKLDGR